MISDEFLKKSFFLCAVLLKKGGENLMLLRIVIVWAVAILCAWLIRTFVPPDLGPVWIRGGVAHGIAELTFNRVGCWLCILVAIVLSIRPAVKLFMQDFGLSR